MAESAEASHHAQLVTLTASLCAAILQTLASYSATQRRQSTPRHPQAANDNAGSVEAEAAWPNDPISLGAVCCELRLNEGQIDKLRCLWGFPAPAVREAKQYFSRTEVYRWASLQPNPDNLAAVLRLRRRRKSLLC